MANDVKKELDRRERQQENIGRILSTWGNPGSHSGLGHGITLFVAGVVVTGQILSEEAYYDALVDQMAEAAESGATEVREREFWEGLREALKSGLPEEPELPQESDADGRRGTRTSGQFASIHPSKRCTHASRDWGS